MTMRLNARSRSRVPSPVLRRSRWPVVFGALLLLWCAWWYCREASQGLLFLAAGLAAWAVAQPRARPATARWVVWGGIVITVACLAANVTRLVPPESAPEELRTLDRVITVVFAWGLTALFFRPSIDGVTLVAAAGLPMAMAVLARGENEPGAAAGFGLLIVWGFVALVTAADLAQRLTQADSTERPGPGLREWGCRVVLLAVLAALAFGLRLPVEKAARGVQKALFGWMMVSDRAPRRRAGDLLLTRLPPSDFGRRTRAVLLIRAERLPGYLREEVFVRYQAGRWAAGKPESPLKEAPTAAADSRQGRYALTAEPVSGTCAVWRVEVVAPALVTRFCLPGRAVELACEGAPPLGDTNGMVAAKEALPDRYDLAVAPGRLIESAYPQPGGFSDPAYLEIPAPLAAAVSNWVSACEGLASAPTTGAALSRAERYFASHFAYRLGLKMRATPDPLMEFMARKEGSCTLFASAAALMFRSCGMPSRLVSGYVSGGWHPWLKRWVVREREAHAWVEVWDRASGRWLVADPTPPDGRPDAFRPPGKLRLAFDLVAAGWKRSLAYLRGANFLEVIADLGAALALLLWEAAASLPGAVVAAGFGALWWLRRRARRQKLTPAERLRAELARAMASFERRAVAAHQRRRRSESWSAWLRRIGPELSSGRADELRGWVDSYQALRYQVRLDETAALAWLARVRGAPAARGPRTPRT